MEGAGLKPVVGNMVHLWIVRPRVMYHRGKFSITIVCKINKLILNPGLIIMNDVPIYVGFNY